MTKFTCQFLDGGRKATQEPNPEYPKGKDVDVSRGRPSCYTEVTPYPAPRCGLILVKCNDCGMTVGLTCAGRPDDPRSVTVPCRKGRQ